VLAAVLFDWGETLMSFSWDEEFMLVGTRAGLAALDRADLPAAEAVGDWFRDHEDELNAGDDELVLVDVLARCFSQLGCSLADDDVRLYMQRSHAAWVDGYRVSDSAHALLEALRARGLKLAIVSNTAQPLWLLQPIFDRQGLTERVDAIVLSSEVGKRKPHPAIFEHALDELGVAAGEALFVGDRLRQDVGGAAAVGMKTAQALWFRADDSEGPHPDFRAFTPMDVLNAVRRLRGEA
jgi:putative hydrolase of the HAD superfamily